MVKWQWISRSFGRFRGSYVIFEDTLIQKISHSAFQRWDNHFHYLKETDQKCSIAGSMSLLAVYELTTLRPLDIPEKTLLFIKTKTIQYYLIYRPKTASPSGKWLDEISWLSERIVSSQDLTNLLFDFAGARTLYSAASCDEQNGLHLSEQMLEK